MESKWLRMVGLPSLRVQPLVVGEGPVNLQFPPLVCLMLVWETGSKVQYWQLIDIPRLINSYCFYKDICPSSNLYPNLLQLPILHLYGSETGHRLVPDSQKVQYLTRQLHVPKLLTEGSKAAPTCSVVWCYIHASLVSCRGGKLPRKCNVLLLPSKFQCMYFIGSTLL